MKSNMNFRLLILILFALYQQSKALQCYVCEKCLEGMTLDVMQICGELPDDAQASEGAGGSGGTTTVSSVASGNETVVVGSQGINNNGTTQANNGTATSGSNQGNNNNNRPNNNNNQTNSQNNRPNNNNNNNNNRPSGNQGDDNYDYYYEYSDEKNTNSSGSNAAASGGSQNSVSGSSSNSAASSGSENSDSDDDDYSAEVRSRLTTQSPIIVASAATPAAAANSTNAPGSSLSQVNNLTIPEPPVVSNLGSIPAINAVNQTVNNSTTSNIVDISNSTINNSTNATTTSSLPVKPPSEVTNLNNPNTNNGPDFDYEYDDKWSKRRAHEEHTIVGKKEKQQQQKRVRRPRYHQVISSRTDDPICYMIKYRINDIVYSDLGCATANNGENSVAICQSLQSATNSSLEDCQLCNRDGCNKFFYNNQTPWTALWNRGDRTISENVICISITLIIAIFLAN